MLIGNVYMFAGSATPSGFLACNGSAVSRTTYADLFAVIDTTYGSGDGSTTFNVPDLSGRVAIGSSQEIALGSTGGEEMHALTSVEIPAHSHSVPSHGHANDITIVTPVLTHTCSQPAYDYNRPNGSTAAGAAGSSQAYSGTSSVAATRSTNLAMANHADAALTVTGGIDDCGAFDTEDSGLGQAHSNMQPYITMNYVIYTGVTS